MPSSIFLSRYLGHVQTLTREFSPSLGFSLQQLEAGLEGADITSSSKSLPVAASDDVSFKHKHSNKERETVVLTKHDG